jgi:UDPglucose 6-dehydrogenase
MYEAVEGAEALLVITEWDQFKQADLKKVKEKMAALKIVDGRNIFDPKVVRKMGFEYVSMGRP